MAKLSSQLSLIGESSSPDSGALARTTNAIRRNKWRLRPLKRLVLPLRNSKRQVLTLLRTVAPGLRSPPVIEHAIIPYIDNHPSYAATEIHPVEAVPPIAHPFQSTNGQHAASSSAPANVFELKEINFWGRYGGCVVTADNKLLADLSPEVWGVENHAIFSQLRLPQLEHLAGQTAIAVTPEAAGNYYHWIVDLLPRLLLIKESRGAFDSFTRVLINGSRARYERESLAALGLPPEKVWYVDAQHRFHLESATISSMDHSCPVVAPWKVRALRSLRDSLPRDCRSYGRRLYVSRRNAAVRRILNEDRLRALLENAGFAVIDLESHSWEEQVEMFANAEVVLAPHGAALANIAFCRPRTLVTEISTRAGYKDFYLRLAASASLRYRVLEVEPRIATNGSTLRAAENEDMIVDEDVLRRFLREL
jgi:capsular polysaccharide biosynthesis protein